MAKIREAWLRRDAALAAAAEALAEARMTDVREFEEMLRAEVPTYGRFCHALYGRLDVDEAVKTGALQRLIASGFASQTAPHLSTADLRRTNGTKVWRLEWPGRKLLDFVGSNRGPLESKQVVELKVVVKEKGRLIDTEFFAHSPSVDANAEIDDMEKLHLVWDCSGVKRRLVYVGLGTNQPYRLEHPESKSAIEGRSRLYIYDAMDRRREVDHLVVRGASTAFDWDWQRYATDPDACAGECVWMLEAPDGSRWCPSDPRVARGAATTKESVARAYQLLVGTTEDSLLPFDELRADQRQEINERFRLSRLRVEPAVERTAPTNPPTIERQIERLRDDYVPYFASIVLTAINDLDGIELRKACSALGAERRAEYEAMFATSSGEVFEDLSADAPATLGELFVSTAATEAAFSAWRDEVAGGICHELYHRGMLAPERSASLLLGVELATSTKYGAIYEKALDVAERALNGEDVHGNLVVTLPDV